MEVLNVAESNFRFASESGHSECWDMGSSLWLIMAESSRERLTGSSEYLRRRVAREISLGTTDLVTVVHSQWTYCGLTEG